MVMNVSNVSSVRAARVGVGEVEEGGLVHGFEDAVLDGGQLGHPLGEEGVEELGIQHVFLWGENKEYI